MTTSLAFEQSKQSTTLISHRRLSRQAHRCLDNVLLICTCCLCLDFCLGLNDTNMNVRNIMAQQMHMTEF